MIYLSGHVTTGTGIDALQGHGSAVDMCGRCCGKLGHAGLIHMPEEVILVTSHCEGKSLSSYTSFSVTNPPPETLKERMK